MTTVLDKVIAKDSEVTMHFNIRLKDGSIATSTKEQKQPMTFKMGEERFSDKFESEMVGLKAGDHKKIMLMPEDAFGEPHEASIFQVPRSRFDKELELEEGLIVMFAQQDGTEMPGVIKALDDIEATVDFNHPLAGQVILFEVDVILVE